MPIIDTYPLKPTPEDTQKVIDYVSKDKRTVAELEEAVRAQLEGKRFADAQHPRGYGK